MTGGLTSPTKPADEPRASPPREQHPAGDQAFPQYEFPESTEVPLDLDSSQTPVPTMEPTRSRKRKKATLPSDRPGRPNATTIHARNSVTIPTETDSERKAFIKRFGAEKGLTAPVLEAIWNARKHGYHKPYDAPFTKFRAFFDEPVHYAHFALTRSTLGM